MSPRPDLKSQQKPGVPDDAKPDPDDEQPDGEERLSDDLREDSIPAVKPPGSPTLWPYAQLPRRMRADFFSYLRSLGAMTNLATLRKRSTLEDFSAMADFMAFVADAEDAIRIVAHPSTADRLDKWLNESDDTEVIALLMWYVNTFQPGEATAS